jgi:serine/threonine protein kinase
LQLPTKFGPYLLLERISVGGMAEVYKAKEYGVEGFERTVAVKRILPHVAEDDEFIAMFKDEAKIAVQLNHGNIAQIYNLGNEQDSFYIALEYVNGRDLRAIFQKCQQQGKPMPVAQACYVIMKICEGLDYAHNKKDKYQRELHIVHRDVSPPNILVSFEGEVKLIDFGVAKAAGRASRTQAGILKGKFGYMSPEQVRGMPLDRRSDVFSVGVVLFEILTNTRLFQAETDFATLEKVRAVEVPRPSSLNPDIPKPLENIIYKALAREPEQRYQSSIELHDELQAFMFAQGLFYSRKDLAAWMRAQYAREIELEKEKDKAQASLRPEQFTTNGAIVPPRPSEAPLADQAAAAMAAGDAQANPQPRRQRKTMMMPPGGGPPPPPPARKTMPPPAPSRPFGAEGGRSPTPPPIPSGNGNAGPASARQGTGVPTATPVPTAAHRSVSIGSGGGMGPPQPSKKVKRKTMVMTTARPNLPPPPGGASPRPRRARDDNEAPTVPLGEALPKPPGLPGNGAARPKGKPRPTGTASYAASNEPPGNDFDWDDDELETRLFEGEEERKAAIGPSALEGDPSARIPQGENDQVGGAIAAPIVNAAEVYGHAQQRPASVTVAPPGGHQHAMPPPQPAVVPGRTVVPMGNQSYPGGPMMAHGNPFPPAPPMQYQHAPGAPGMTVGAGMPAYGSPGMGGPHHQHMGGPAPGMTQAMPNIPPSAIDYDERQGQGSSTGPIIGILIAVIVLLVAGFAVFLMFKDDGGDPQEVAKATTGAEPAKGTPPAGEPAQTGVLGALTVQSTPADATVTVDGKPVAGESPFVVTNLAAGKHKVAIAKDGYLPVEREIDLTSTGLIVPVTLQYRDVTLILETDPKGSQMNLIADGKAVPMGVGGGQYQLTRQPGVKYEVEALAKGYHSRRTPLDFTGENQQKVALTLVRDGSVAIATPTEPVPAEEAAVAPTRQPKKQYPRRPNNGGGNSGGTNASSGTPGTSTTPPPTTGKTATLHIGTNKGVEPAEIYIDGTRRGKTPLANIKVTPGRHTIKFKWPDGREATRRVDVPDGGTEIVKMG